MRYQTAPCPALKPSEAPLPASTARGRASYGTPLGSVNLTSARELATCGTMNLDDPSDTGRQTRARLIDGKAIAQASDMQVRGAVESSGRLGARRPGLAVVLVGNDPASEVYVRNKRRACEEVGIISVAHDLPAGTGEAELLALIATDSTMSRRSMAFWCSCRCRRRSARAR